MKCITASGISFFVLVLAHAVAGQNQAIQTAQHSSSGPRIVGGRNAFPEELPFQVSIQRKFSLREGTYHWCGGSIIDSEHVLTAGHCVYGLSPEEFVIYAGVLNNTEESSEDTKVVRQVTEVFLHEGYDHWNNINDIAIVKVSPGFPTDNPAVKAIPLSGDVTPDGLECTVSGWGRLGYTDQTMPQILQAVNVPFISLKECNKIYGSQSYDVIQPGMNCAGYLQGGKDTCIRDSGGPLQCKGILTGVVSWGVECALPNNPGVYADVEYYKEWIDNKILKSKEEDLFKKFNHKPQNSRKKFLVIEL